ncbi:MAG: DUF2163 domain-containing protein [Rhodobiaceae bacterium]|nr:DUF2163 domain-containing protein [Rhodobiaceae bacterium]
MKALSPDFQTHLDTGVTTLCWCWRITRRDGAVLGFTDHDEAVDFDGVSHEPDSGFTSSALTANLGLSVDDADVEGVLSSDAITETDLVKGLYDGATVRVYRVNWADPDQRVLMRSGTIGEVERTGAAFRAEFRGLTDALQQPVGRVFQAGCDAELGDARCGVDLEQAAYKGTGQVVADLGDGWLTATGLESFAEGWFSGGTLTVTSGEATGAVYRIRTHRRDTGGDTLALWQTPAVALVTGIAFEARTGCDKTFATCAARFANIANFRGFPHMPGNDFILGYPRAGDPSNDGGSRND